MTGWITYYICATFELLSDGAGGRAIRCRGCGLVSYNPNDVANRYCGNCHQVLEEPQTLGEPDR